MQPGAFTWQWTRGDDARLVLTFPSTWTGLDLTKCVLACQIRRTPASPLPSVTCTVTALDALDCIIDPGNTLGAGTYCFDFEVTLPGQTLPLTLIAGPVIVNQDVTQP